MTSRMLAVAVALLVSPLVGCSSDDEPPESGSPSASSTQEPSPSTRAPSAEQSTSAARRLLDRLRRSTVRANTGSYSFIVDLGPGTGSARGVGSYSMDPYLGTNSVHLPGPEGDVQIESLNTKDDVWYRIFGAGGNPLPSCWIHAKASVLASMQGFDGPTPDLGMNPVVAALDRSVRPAFVDDKTLRVSADLHSIAGTVPGGLAAKLGIPLRSRDKVDIELAVEGGEFHGWSVRLGDIVQAAIDAGHADESELPPGLAGLATEVVVTVRELGEDVSITPPTRDIVELTLDDLAGYEEAINNCSVV